MIQSVRCPKKVVPRHRQASESPRGLVKHRALGPTPEFLIQYVRGGAGEFSFLIGSQVTLLLAVWGTPL